MTDYSREGIARLDELFGRRMKAIREARRIPQQHVAMNLSMLHGMPWHQSTVGKVESGLRPVRLAEAVAIAAVLAVPLQELLTEDVEPGHEPSQAALRQASIGGQLHEAVRMRGEVDRLRTTVADRVDQLEKALQEAAGGDEDDPGA